MPQPTVTHLSLILSISLPVRLEASGLAFNFAQTWKLEALPDSERPSHSGAQIILNKAIQDDPRLLQLATGVPLAPPVLMVL